jgi:hypothetical protein
MNEAINVSNKVRLTLYDADDRQLATSDINGDIRIGTLLALMSLRFTNLEYIRIGLIPPDEPNGETHN